MIKIHNVESGEIIEREMTQSELENFAATNQSILAEKASEEAALSAKQLAHQKLVELGLSIDDLKALGL